MLLGPITYWNSRFYYNDSQTFQITSKESAIKKIQRENGMKEPLPKKNIVKLDG